MDQKTHDYIAALLPEGGQVYEWLEESRKEGIPVITRDALQMIRVLIQAKHVRSVLEIGTATGASAMLFASFMANEGRVTTIERDDFFFLRASQAIHNQGFEDQITVIHGDAAEVLKELSGSFDMIFLDGAKGHYIHMLDDCVRLLPPGGLLIGDNVLFRGMVSGDAPLIRRKITIVKRLRKFLDAITHREDLVSTVLPIGDGMSISVKK